MVATNFKIVRSCEGNTYLYDAENVKISRIQGSDDIDSKELEELFEKEICIESQKQDRSATLQTFKNSMRKVERLTLVLLNSCNIACEYCYEDEGTFGLDYSKMSLEIAIKSIDTIYEAYDEIDTLMFFGGEPLILHRMFPAICDYVIEKCRSINSPRPNFGLITNGLLVNDRVISILKEYGMSVTVSIDGPERIHNHYRKSKLGAGTFKGALRGYKALKEAGIPTFIQSTLDEGHLEYEDVKSIISYLNEELGCETPHVTIAATDDCNEVKPKMAEGFAEASKEFLNSILDGSTTPRFSHGEAILRSLIFQRKSSYTCPAGFEIAVSPTGDLYPCFMFVGDEKQKLGSVQKGIDDSYWEKLATFLKISAKDDRLGCSKCWARNLCTSCMGNNLNATGYLEENPKFHCDIIRSSAEVIIGSLGDLQTKPDQWKKFVQNAQAPATQQNC